MVFDHLAKGEIDVVIEEMVEEAVHTIENIMDDPWVTWVG